MCRVSVSIRTEGLDRRRLSSMTFVQHQRASVCYIPALMKVCNAFFRLQDADSPHAIPMSVLSFAWPYEPLCLLLIAQRDPLETLVELYLKSLKGDIGEYGSLDYGLLKFETLGFGV